MIAEKYFIQTIQTYEFQVNFNLIPLRLSHSINIL